MNTFYYWLYEHDPNWSSNTWEWIILGIGVFSLVLRFIAKRTKTTLDDRATVAVDFGESVARNLQKRAKAKELQK